MVNFTVYMVDSLCTDKKTNPKKGQYKTFCSNLTEMLSDPVSRENRL